MAKVIFYEKPGCANNARQKALLAASGHQLDVRNLLTEPWTEAGFDSSAVDEWIGRGRSPCQSPTDACARRRADREAVRRAEQ
jgi:hypothetical protein